MDDRLLIPLDVLPGPLPVGAPLVCRVVIDGLHDDEQALRLMSRDEATFLILELHPNLMPRARVVTYLDLTPPETDAAGYPTRIDGLDVAVAMLARAMGRTLWTGNKCIFGQCFGIKCLSIGHCSDVSFAERRRGAPNYLADAIIIPALTDIDPTDRLAPRLAIAAIMRARPWAS